MGTAQAFDVTCCWMSAWVLLTMQPLAPQTGQTICAVAQAFLLSVPPRLSAVWFGAHELNRATALGVLANQVQQRVARPRCNQPRWLRSLVAVCTGKQTGIAVGFFVAPLVAPNGGLLWRLLLSHAVFATIACVLVLLFLANKPPVPPSFSQVSSQVVGNQRSYRYELWHLCTDRSFFLLLQAYVCMGMYALPLAGINMVACFLVRW